MDIDKILRCVDHTELKVTATMSDIINLCDDAVRYNTASVCIAPCFVKGAKDYLKDKKAFAPLSVFQTVIIIQKQRFSKPLRLYRTGPTRSIW